MADRPPIGEAFAVTKTLVSILAEAAIGEKLSYQRLSRAINMDVQREAYGYMKSARDIVQREHGIVFDVEWDAGLIRVGGVGKTNIGQAKIRKGVRSVKRGRHTLDTVNKREYEEMDNDKKAEWNATKATAGIIELTASLKVRRRIEEKAKEEQKQPSLTDTLKALTQKKTGT